LRDVSLMKNNKFIWKFVVAGFLIPLSWLTFWELFEEVIMKRSAYAFKLLHKLQFLTWPTSFPGVNPFYDQTARYGFLATTILLNMILYFLAGFLISLILRRSKK
ncbi:MAG: hypothetical protein V1855_03620, partial [bacterium]